MPASNGRSGDAPMIIVPRPQCRVPGCDGVLTFDVDQLGRTVDVCPACTARVQRVRALELLVASLQRGDIAVHQLGSSLGSWFGHRDAQ